MKVKRLIMLLFILFSVAPILAVGAGCIAEFGGRTQELLRDHAGRTARMEANVLEEFFSQREINLQIIGELQVVRDLLNGSQESYAQTADILAVRTELQPFIRTVYVLDAQGKIICTSNENMLNEIPENARAIPKGTRVVYGEISGSSSILDGPRTLWMASPVAEGDRVLGYVTAEVDLRYFDTRVQGMSFFQNGFIMITDAAGREVASGGNGKLAALDPEEARTGFLDAWEDGTRDENTGYLEYTASGIRVLGCYAQIRQNGWRVITLMDWNELTEPTRNAVNAMFLLLLLLLLLMLGVYVIITRLVTAPINCLIDTARRIRNGETGARSNYRRPDEFGEISTAFDTMMDALAENERGLQLNEERYRIVAEQSDSVIFEYNVAQESCECTAKWLAKFGYCPAGEQFVPFMSAAGRIHPDDVPLFQKTFGSMLDGKREHGRCEVRMLLPDGGYLWCSLRITLLKGEDGKVSRLIGRFSDIDSRKRETEALRKKAQKDQLTGLYNKLTAERMISDYLEGEGAEGTHALFVLDIDCFKQINDTLGHLAGDRVIREVASLTELAFRSTDILGRMGGDELVVLLKNITSEKVLHEKAQTLVDSLRRQVFEDNKEQAVSCSIGIALYPENGNTYFELFKKADEALYEAKRNGRKQYRLAPKKDEI